LSTNQRAQQQRERGEEKIERVQFHKKMRRNQGPENEQGRSLEQFGDELAKSVKLLAQFRPRPYSSDGRKTSDNR